ncbi:hypothetical protein DM992_25320 [Burkholderia sp. JP2-270]|nr:hypothetical protein DM992_25320 [Burkholderia sp. JP2-270]
MAVKRFLQGRARAARRLSVGEIVRGRRARRRNAGIPAGRASVAARGRPAARVCEAADATTMPGLNATGGRRDEPQ